MGNKKLQVIFYSITLFLILSVTFILLMETFRIKLTLKDVEERIKTVSIVEEKYMISKQHCNAILDFKDNLQLECNQDIIIKYIVMDKEGNDTLYCIFECKNENYKNKYRCYKLKFFKNKIVYEELLYYDFYY